MLVAHKYFKLVSYDFVEDRTLGIAGRIHLEFSISVIRAFDWDEFGTMSRKRTPKIDKF